MYVYIYTHLRGGSTTSISASPARTKMRSPSRSSRTFTCSVDRFACFFLLQYICLYMFWLYDLVYWGPWAEHGDPLFFEHEHSEFYNVCTLESWEIAMFRLGKTGGFPASFLRLPRAFFSIEQLVTGDWRTRKERQQPYTQWLMIIIPTKWL